MLLTKNARRGLVVGCFILGSYASVISANCTSECVDSSACVSVQANNVVIVPPAKKAVRVVSCAARVVQTLVRFGVSAAGIVAIVDAFSNKSGAALYAQAGLGLFALLGACCMGTSWDNEDACGADCCSYADDCHDCYHHDIYHHHDVCFDHDPVIIHHDHIELIQPAIVEPVVVPAPVEPLVQPAADVAPATTSVNADNVEVNNFWNDPFNY